MKDDFGYDIRVVNGEKQRHEYIVDGCNVEPGYTPEAGMFTIEDTRSCRTKVEAMQAMKAMCKSYYKVTIYDEWQDVEGGCLVSQKITDYRKGKVIGGITM